MRRRRLGTLSVLWMGVCGLSILSGGVALAQAVQSLRDLRVGIYPLNRQIGIVTRASGKAAWIQTPHQVPMGAKVQFTHFSDGGDVLAEGKVTFTLPVPPYEAYVTEVKPVTKRHPRNPNDSLLVEDALFRPTVALGARSWSEADAGYLAIGTYVRTTRADEKEDAETLEPVRAHLAALRQRRNPTAHAIVEAVSPALVPDPVSTSDYDPTDNAVDYSTLSTRLRRFQKLAIADPITAKLFRRLWNLAQEHGTPSAKVPLDFLRPTPSGQDREGRSGGTP